MIAGMLSIGFIMWVCLHIGQEDYHVFSSLHQTTLASQVDYSIPVVSEHDFIVDNAILDKDSLFNWKDYVHVSSESVNLIDYVSVSGSVDTSVVGDYTLTFRLYYNGEEIIKEATFYVKEGN